MGRALVLLIFCSVRAHAQQHECFAELDRLGVEYEALTAIDGVELPLRLRGSLAGARIEGPSDPIHDVVDCRLALALHAWIASSAVPIRAIRHFSIYRPGARIGGGDRVSGHAHGLAIDIGAIETDRGALEVESGWQERTAGAPPCAQYDESEESAALRGLVCAAASSGLFEVVLTPHFNAAHGDHVHLEVRPDVDWLFLR